MRADTRQRAAQSGIFAGTQRFCVGCNITPHGFTIHFSKRKNVTIADLSQGQWKSSGLRPQALPSGGVFERALPVKAKHYDFGEILSDVPWSIGGTPCYTQTSGRKNPVQLGLHFN